MAIKDSCEHFSHGFCSVYGIWCLYVPEKNCLTNEAKEVKT